MESSNVIRQKNCLVMAAAAAVQAAREQSDGEEKVCFTVLHSNLNLLIGR